MGEDEETRVNRRIRRLGVALVVLFAFLFAQITYIQVFAAARISGNPANATRQIIAEYKVDRGPILAADGVTYLALSQPTKGHEPFLYARRYPDGPLYADVTGFYSRIYGRTGLEDAMNPYLAGSAAELTASTFADLVLGRPKKGGAVVTTIDAHLQRVASAALGSLPGAVVALDPATGDVLALVSNPAFDPNLLSSKDTKTVRDAWKRLSADPSSPLLSRATDELFPPGSTFKMITASAALENGYGPTSLWPNPHQLDLPLTTQTIQNFGGEQCPGGVKTTLLIAFTDSCNVIFGEVGLQLGAVKLAAQARAYGFCPTDPPKATDCLSPTIPFTIPFQSGRFPEARYFTGNDPLVAISAIGQDNDLANPLQMALVASAIANGGTMMDPRLVSQIRDPQGRVIRDFAPQVYGQPISKTTATELRAMMVSVVASGTGTAAQIPGVVVAGKTGTAQHGGSGTAPHAWFVSFAPAGPTDHPRIAVAVIVLDGGSLGSEATGGRVAAPIAKQVIESFLAERVHA
jgi:peptidoglycan glycosyltransferase